MKVLILYNGDSRFEIEKKHSIEYAKTVLDVLKNMGKDAILCEYNTENLIRNLRAERNLIVFNAIMGPDGEDGRLQALLDLIRIPYTGSGFKPCIYCFDKAKFKLLINQIRIRTPRFQLINYLNWKFKNSPVSNRTIRKKFYIDNLIQPKMNPPIIVKANTGAFSYGSSILNDYSYLPAALEKASEIDNEIILEEYIEGIDAHLPILNGEALHAIEKRRLDEKYSRNGISEYSFTVRNSHYIIPGRFNKNVYEKMKKYATKVYNLLGCQGLCRADFRINSQNEVYFLEMNTQHSIRIPSMAVMSAYSYGISIEGLVERILFNNQQT